MDSAINNEIQLVLSKEFEDSLGAFGVFKLVQSGTNFLFLCFLIPYIVGQWVRLGFLTVVALIGVFNSFFLLCFDWKDAKIKPPRLI